MVKRADDKNRTGAMTAKARVEEMVAGTREFPPTKGGPELMAQDFEEQFRESAAIGTVPPPASGPVSAEQLLLMDKLGARIAFERTGVRLYEALMAKCNAGGEFPGGPSPDDLEELRDEEHEHFELLTECTLELGGDPTALTPAADVEGLASMGIPKVISDPRTTLLQSLEAMLVAELADNECWDTLVTLARAFGKDEVADRFEKARIQEEEHLAKVRGWVLAGTGKQAGVELPGA